MPLGGTNVLYIYLQDVRRCILPYLLLAVESYEDVATFHVPFGSFWTIPIHHACSSCVCRWTHRRRPYQKPFWVVVSEVEHCEASLSVQKITIYKFNQLLLWLLISSCSARSFLQTTASNPRHVGTTCERVNPDFIWFYFWSDIIKGCVVMCMVISSLGGFS